jgi:hypothetical protein
MNKNFNTALEKAFNKEFSWLDHFENPYSTYGFSSQFESNIKSIIPKSAFTYVSVGKKRIRKTLLVALVALLALVITGCAVAVHYIIEWHEEQNINQGTLDVTFDIKGQDAPEEEATSIPETPTGYTITEQHIDVSSCIIIYSDSQENQIVYSLNNIDNMKVSIDNEVADFEETIINGCKGYSSSKDGTNALYWASVTHFYELQGTCDMGILLTMAESMVN